MKKKNMCYERTSFCKNDSLTLTYELTPTSDAYCIPASWRDMATAAAC